VEFALLFDLHFKIFNSGYQIALQNIFNNLAIINLKLPLKDSSITITDHL
jgi:hypothetical protein